MLYYKAIFKRFIRSLKRLMRTHYPSFILGRPLKEGYIPVFVYHEVDAQSFSSDLGFLRDNGYHTLTTEEFILFNGKNKNGRAVLLTFDDARRNFWEVAFPLLKEFSAKATLFVPTHWVGNESDTATDMNFTKANTFMTWDQLRICTESGLIDVQSHGHRHALVYTSPKLVTFASCTDNKRIDLFDWPMRREKTSDILGPPPLGTPIYTATPLLSAKCRVIENEVVVRACQDVVNKTGDKELFSKLDWMSHLHRIHKNLSDQGYKPTFIPREELLALVRSEFELSRRVFLRELGRPPRYFAFPWMLGSNHSMRYAAESGIQAVFGVGLDYYRIKNLKGPLPAFYRIKGDWVRFLPGKGRKTLRNVLPGKMCGFLSSQHLAH